MRISAEHASTLSRINARLRARGIEYEYPNAEGWSLVSHGAWLLGAKNPYMAVVYPEYLSLIIDNKPLPVENVPPPY